MSSDNVYKHYHFVLLKYKYTYLFQHLFVYVAVVNYDSWYHYYSDHNKLWWACLSLLYGNQAVFDNAAENGWTCNIHGHILLRLSADYYAAIGGLIQG